MFIKNELCETFKKRIFTEHICTAFIVPMFNTLRCNDLKCYEGSINVS